MVKALLGIAACIAFVGAFDAATRKHEPNVYEAWTDTGVHLMMSDNGTDTPEDDIVIDWEDNRQFEIYLNE